jgi:hypothetical protein
VRVRVCVSVCVFRGISRNLQAYIFTDAWVSSPDVTVRGLIFDYDNSALPVRIHAMPTYMPSNKRCALRVVSLQSLER